ncbi:carboxymuconolactone decarboxylase family protein [Acinetobacter venetianus]|jgi:AhpD family alkylhydroperoxidase|uniref:carboxymuconolactone decarboxylase family protein n=1 Tax=Acinetobacter venetianus TaxID=52133 RepID=UPI001A176081|nr:carboxymuconolactone decarboxylase family protein [Acinetobacter venetianus]MEC8567340.1 carboxymuconolactone decarboxylase family protein [Pseudomonadota bacterium]HIQ33285.1 carboxymuconolactone decarboxylase family protein [Acinetobacter venetianus]HJP46526.1 carboxymuconolactone decarboxylase family protein [Acinetobacter venetianus]
MTTHNIHPQKHLPGAIHYLQQVHQYIEQSTLIERSLYHLVLLRASQINQCAFCVKMHIAEALADGETQTRLDRLIVWRHCSDFSVQEKAAFAWVEALTTLQVQTDYEPLRVELLQYFSEAQISALTLLIGMINLWNRIGIAQH